MIDFASSDRFNENHPAAYYKTYSIFWKSKFLENYFAKKTNWNAVLKHLAARFTFISKKHFTVVHTVSLTEIIRMIINDQCDVKNVFESADWLKDPFDVTFDPDWVAPTRLINTDVWITQPEQMKNLLKKGLIVHISFIEYIKL